MTIVDSETATTGVKALRTAAALNHIKNNRTEYLVLLVFSHMLGLTDVLFQKASGVCG